MRVVNPILVFGNQALLWVACICVYPNLLAQKSGKINAYDVNIRAQPTIYSEVVTRMNYGDPVTIIEEIEQNNDAASDPDIWFKIKMPNRTPVWVSADYVDPTSKEVTASRLNVRSGPGVNYSIVDRVDRGTKVDILSRKDEWLEIATTSTAYAFVASKLVDVDAVKPPVKPAQPSQTQRSTPNPASAGSTLKPVPPPPVTEPETSRTNPQNVQKNTEIFKEMEPVETSSKPVEVMKPIVIPSGAANTTRKPISIESSNQVSNTPPTTPKTPPVELESQAQPTVDQKPEFEAVPQIPSTVRTTEEPVETPAPKPVPSGRVIIREGKIGSAKSLLAPGAYTLKSLYNGRTINFLYNEEGELDLSKIRGYSVRVEGKEMVDPRWPETPIIEIEKLILID